MLKRALTSLSFVLFALLVATYAALAWKASREPPEHAAPNRTGYYAAAENDPNVLIAKYTGWLAGFTGLLFVVSSFQIYFLIRADKTSRLAADAARDAAQAAKTQAEEMRKTTALTGLQTDEITKQKEIERLRFVTENGPKLRVRNIVVEMPFDGGGFANIKGHCYVENIGGMTATVEASHLEFFANQMGLPMESPYEGVDANNIIGGGFKIGQSRRFSFVQMSPFTTPEEAWRAESGNFPTFILGWIHYRDDTEYGMNHGKLHRIAFCRRWDHIKRRLIRVENDHDYEYEG